MKQKLLLKVMLLLCALVAGGSSSWATDITLTASSGFGSSYGSDHTFTVSTIGFKDSGIMYNAKGTPQNWAVKQLIQMRKSGSGAGTIYNTSAISTITSVEVTLVNNNNGFTLYYGTSENPSTNSIASSSLTPTSGTFSYTKTDNATASATSYKYTFDLSSYNATYIKIVNGSSANYVGSIVINYSASSTPTISANDVNIDHDATGGSIEYSLANATGNVTASKTGDWLTLGAITASAVPFTCSANTGSARTATVTLSFEGATDKVVTITQFSGIEKPTFSKYGAVTAGTQITLTQATATSIRYTLDGTDPTKTTGTVYSDPITINTPTTIKAIAIENGEVSDVATAEYTISVEAPTFTPESSSYLPGAPITISSAGNTVYYTLTTDGSNPGTPSSSSTPYTGPIVLGSTTTKIKAIAYDAYDNKSSVTGGTFTIATPASLPFSWAGGGKNDLTALTGVIANDLGGDYDNAHSPYLVKFDGDDDYIEIFTDEKPEKVSIGVKMIGGANTSTIKVQESANGAEFTDVQELTISGKSNAILNLATTNAFASTTRVVRLLFVKGSNVGVGPISISANRTITLNAACTDGTLVYGTYSSGKAFVVPSNLIVSEISVIGGQLYIEEYDEGDVVPANTGVMVAALAGGNYDVNLSSEAGTSVLGSDNMLKPSGDAGIDADGMATAAPSSKYYRLTMHNGTKLGFWWGAASGAAFALAANKAYLAVPTGTPAPEFFGFGNEATSIESIMTQKTKGEVYDLQGRKVANPAKGLYIVNGKKYVVK